MNVPLSGCVGCLHFGGVREISGERWVICPELPNGMSPNVETWRGCGDAEPDAPEAGGRQRTLF